MNTPHRPRCPDRNCRRTTPMLSLLASIVVLTTGLRGAVSSEAGPKDHVLFVGTDLAVKEGSEFYHVVGAKKDALLIEKNHRLTDVRLGQGANIKVSRGVKLSNRSATIGNVQTESVDRESARAQLAAMRASMLLMDEASDQEDRLHGKMTILSAVQSSPEGSPPPPGANGSPPGANDSRRGPTVRDMQKAAEAAYVGALPQLDRATAAASTFLSETLNRADPIEDEVIVDASSLPGLELLGRSPSNVSVPRGSADAASAQSSVRTGTAEVELTFEVSSPIPLDHAYMVVVANYGSTNKTDEVSRQVSTREFDHIDSHPQRVRMRHAASINGRPFRRFDMGLYASGQEVATNLSEKRMALTSDQAFQFFLIEYLSSHKGATLSPTPVLMTPRVEFRRQVEKSDVNQTIYANVDKMGTVLSTSTDVAGTQRLPAALESALQNVRFMPALEKGTPVDGRIKVTLAQLAN